METAIAILAFIVSAISYWLSLKTSISDIRPVLVFVYDGRKGWMLKNIGKGPALNIIVAQKKHETWFNPVRIPPLSPDSEFFLQWLGHVNDTGLGANYNDFNDKQYSSTCGNDLSQVYDKPTLQTWSENEIGRHWNHSVYKSGV
jgi:hypothetical protein